MSGRFGLAAFCALAPLVVAASAVAAVSTWARGEVVGVLQRCVTLLAQLLVVLLLLWGVLAVVEQIAALMA